MSHILQSFAMVLSHRKVKWFSARMFVGLYLWEALNLSCIVSQSIFFRLFRVVSYKPERKDR